MNYGAAVLAGPTLTIFPPKHDACRTICVLGASKGGAALAAGILHKLGIFMGDHADAPMGEDPAFLSHDRRTEIFQEAKHSLEKVKYLDGLSRVIADRNADHAVWGWKDPVSVFYLQDIMPLLRNPVFILVTRDPGAIAQRVRMDENLVAHRALLANIKASSLAYDRIADMLRQRARPTLLISYERALRAPVSAGRAIANFLGLEPPPYFDSWLEGFIVADKQDDGGLTPAPTSVLHFQSTTAVRTLVGESLRPRHEGFAEDAVSQQTDIVLACDALYEGAVSLLNQGDHFAAQDKALAILNLNARDCPGLIDGALGVLAETQFGGSPEPTFPDVVCGAFYVMGLSCLLQTHGQRALINLSVAERIMRRRLQHKLPDSILSSANYWNCVFHIGVAAKAIGRSDLLDEARSRIFAAGSSPPAPELAVLGTIGLPDVQARASTEH